jgi:CrcB protein
MNKLLLIGAGGAVGSVLRYLLGQWVGHAGGFPVATLLVNVTGCLAIGLAAGACRPGGAWPLREDVQLALMVGLLGGYTTFSTFGRETLGLIEAGRWGLAAGYVAASNVLGMGAVWVGWAVTRPASVA